MPLATNTAEGTEIISVMPWKWQKNAQYKGHSQLVGMHR